MESGSLQDANPGLLLGDGTVHFVETFDDVLDLGGGGGLLGHGGLLRRGLLGPEAPLWAGSRAKK